MHNGFGKLLASNCRPGSAYQNRQAEVWARLEGGGQHGDALLGLPFAGGEARHWRQHPVPHLVRIPGISTTGRLNGKRLQRRDAVRRPCLSLQCSCAP